MSAEARDVAVILDPGSDTIKAGFNSDDTPALILQDIGLDKKQTSKQEQSAERNHNHVTHNNHEKPLSVYKHPIEHGIVVDWEILEDVFHHTFKKLNINTEKHNVLVSETPLNPKYLRERMTQMILETFEFPGFYIKDTCALTLFNTGRVTGVVVASGDAVTNTAVVQDGSTLRDTIPKTFYAGRDTTFHLKTLLTLRGCSSEWLEHGHILNAIKENMCFVTQNFEKDFRSSKDWSKYESQYSLPDGSTLTLDAERFLCPEGLFQPQMFDCNCAGIHRQVHRTILFADSDLHSVLYPNIVTGGGNTMFKGLGSRLKKELDKISDNGAITKVTEEPDRHHAAWLGGAIYSQSENMEWITRQEYEEYGPKIVNKKCF